VFTYTKKKLEKMSMSFFASTLAHSNAHIPLFPKLEVLLFSLLDKVKYL